MALALSNAHRAELKTLTRLAERDLSRLWTEVDSAVAAREALMDLLPRLTRLYGSAAATLAADYYDDAREAAEARGRFRAIAAETTPVGALEALAGVAVGPLFGAKPDHASALVLAQGGLQRHIANTSRLTITGSSVQDRAAAGWQRIGTGNCEFCRMLLGRGAVYSEATADFSAHDHCSCSAEPVFT